MGFLEKKILINRRYIYIGLGEESKNKNYVNADKLNQQLKAKAGTYGKTTSMADIIPIKTSRSVSQLHSEDCKRST